jgi:hypothetical protein
VSAAGLLRGPGKKKGGGFAAAHIQGVPRMLRGRSSGLKDASRFLRKWPSATRDPGDLGAPWRQEERAGPGLPARRAARMACRGGRLRTPDAREHRELAFDPDDEAKLQKQAQQPRHSRAIWRSCATQNRVCMKPGMLQDA